MPKGLALNYTPIILATIWGAIAGYLLLRILINLLGGLFCLHALLLTRWKRLAKKAGPGQIKYSNTLRLLLRVTLSGALCLLLLEIGHNLLRGEFRFYYHGVAGLAWGIAAALVAAFFLRKSWRQLGFIWKLTHEVGYAEKQRRTTVLKR